MKLFPKLAFSFLLTSMSLVAEAQVNINIVQPAWGPAVPAGKQYYYIPEASSYYDLSSQRYIVQQNGKWVRTANLNGYTPSSFHPVVIDYVGAQPWSQYSRHRTLYPVSLPPGQVKRLENGKGLPPGQAKKLGTMQSGGVYVVEGKNKGGKGNGHGNGKGNGKH